MNRWLPWLLSALGITLLAGCHCHDRCACPRGGYPAPPPPCTPMPPAPMPQPVPPPGAAVPAPPPGAPVPPPAFPTTPAPAPANYEPPPAVPAENGVRLAPPEASAPPSPEPPRLGVQERPADAPTPALPVGIAQFAFVDVQEKIAAGLKPQLDGLDWLKARGFKTVLHIRKPGAPDDADRRLVEMRGMKYQSLEVSPQSVNQQLVDQFNRAILDRAGLPVFVYDQDGSLAGALWYLHFRSAARQGDEEARNRATRLGLRPDADGAPRELWLAIQKFLSQQP